MKQSGAKDWAFDYSVNFDDFNNSPVFDSFHYPILTGNATLKEYWAFVNAILFLYYYQQPNHQL
jgi:hypothetical protein